MLLLRTWILTWLAIALAAVAIQTVAQQPANPPNAFPGALAAPVTGPQSAALSPGDNVTTGTNVNTPLGGAANADFDSLIDLIVSTVSTETWAENGGGEAEIRPFPGGVLVDAAGTLRLKSRSSGSSQANLATLRGDAPVAGLPTTTAEARKASKLRYISLPRLEREIVRRQAAHKPFDTAMLTLAGLQRVRYVFVYPETGDLVLAGPAGDWRIDADGRILSTETGEAVMRLDDLLVLWRRGKEAEESHFGCSINPKQESLANTQAYLASTSQRPLQPGQRKQWLGKLRDTVGLQDIEVFGVDPASRVASVLVEADYHMKLIGMGLADGVDGVDSYLASIRVTGGQSPPPMSVLRWWFALNYDAIHTSPDKDAFALAGQGVRVLSENELLAEQGQRVHTGQSEPLNRQFAEQFTSHFAELAVKYPVYSELRSIFDLAMAVAVVQTNGLAEQVGWQAKLMSDAERLRLPRAPVPRQVETVINHRVINRRHIVAGVSGGVLVAPGDLLKDGRIASNLAQLAESKREAPGIDVEGGAWWWDAAN
jgi:hypothetical protein